MAVIQSKDGYTADVDGANSQGLNIDTGLRQVIGAYRASAANILTAAQANAAIELVIKNGGGVGTMNEDPRHIGNMKKMFITYMKFKLSVHAATTVHSPFYAMSIGRFSNVTAITGGTQITSSPIRKKPWGENHISSVEIPANGEIRLATSAITFTTVPATTYYDMIHMALFPQPLTAPTIATEREFVLEMNGSMDHPLEVAPGTGLVVVLTETATTTTLQNALHFEMGWYEAL